MKTISIVNLKGGVGKTITAVNMAQILAADYGKRVLLIDADHQGNTTKFYGVSTDAGTLADAFGGLATVPENVIKHTVYRNLDLIPADMSLASVDLQSDADTRAALLRTLPDLCDALDDQMDYVIFDCPPAFSVACISAIAASNDVIIPVKPGMFEMEGMSELIDQVVDIQRTNPAITIAGVLLTMWHNADVVLQGEQFLRQHVPVRVFDTHIRRTDKVDESTYAREPITEWSPRSSAAQDYRAFVAEYLRGEQDGEET